MQDKKNILIIEDEKEIADLLVEFFEKNNFSAVSMPDGIKGLKYVKEHLPDMVITDLLLPGEHGIDVLKAVKDQFFLPVIIISGIYKEEELAQLIDDYFVDGFFEKPLDLNALLEKVNTVLSSKPSA